MNEKQSSKKEIFAEHKQAKISASKVRLVAKMIKPYKVDEAVVQLGFIHKKAASLILKVLKSAIANAQHNLELDISDLKIKNIEVTEGPTLKRWRARSRGMGNRINKRTSHIKVVLFAENNKITPKTVVNEKKQTDSLQKGKDIKEKDKKNTSEKSSSIKKDKKVIEGEIKKKSEEKKS